MPNATFLPSLRSLLRLLVASVLLCAGLSHASSDAARTALHLLDYIAVDYAEAVDQGQVKNADEYQEMQEFAQQALGLIQALPAQTERAALQADAERLQRSIAAKAAATDVSQQANALRWALIRAYQVQVTPKSAPDLQRAATLYASLCASCHGVQGRGDGPASRGLEPAPSNFHDGDRMAQRSVYGLYNTITLGVNGTAMASYSQLNEEERWGLALFVANFAPTPALRQQGEALWQAGQGRQAFPDLANVVSLSPQEIRARFGDEGVALQSHLWHKPQALAAGKPAPLVWAMQTLQQSQSAYRQGQRSAAAQLSIQAYLEGFELVESSLNNVDPTLMLDIERAMMGLRQAIQSGAPVEQVTQQTEHVIGLLEQARSKLDGAQLSNTTTFVSALIILLREGIEALLVVAAILAFTRRAGRADAQRWVHIGWVLALLLGLVTWAVSNYLVEISGASREVTEGLTALVAAAMLLYIGYWMHSKSNSQAWQKFIGSQVGDSLAQGTLRSLAVVSFLAVYREAFETVLFLQALSTQAGPSGHGALLGGLATAAVLLGAASWAILRASVKLPLGLFFSTSGILLVVLAVIFTGQGIAALQEAGTMGAVAVDFVRVPLLGIYPTWQSLSAQAAVALLSGLMLWWSARQGRTPSPR